MKKLNWIAISALAALVTQTAGAVDVDEGADALFSQVRSSQVVALAKLVSVDPTGLNHAFDLIKALESKGPQLEARFSVALPFSVAQSVALRPGAEYLVFLNSAGRAGGWRPAMSFYSFQAASQNDLPLLTEVVGQYAKWGTDRVALKNSVKSLLARTAIIGNAFVQYSLVSDLTGYLNPTAADATLVAQMLQQGKLTEVRARAIALQQIGQFKLAQFTPTVEAIALDSRQPVGMKVHALDALVDLDAKPSLRRVLPVLEQSPSAKLKRRVGQVLNPKS